MGVANQSGPVPVEVVESTLVPSETIRLLSYQIERYRGALLAVGIDPLRVEGPCIGELFALARPKA